MRRCEWEMGDGDVGRGTWDVGVIALATKLALQPGKRAMGAEEKATGGRWGRREMHIAGIGEGKKYGCGKRFSLP